MYDTYLFVFSFAKNVFSEADHKIEKKNNTLDRNIMLENH